MRCHVRDPAATDVQLTSFAPQFLVDDLARSMAYYQLLGFLFDEPWDGFYAVGRRDGLELHLKSVRGLLGRRHDDQPAVRRLWDMLRRSCYAE